jgi:quinol monooxygenase YgiN
MITRIVRLSFDPQHVNAFLQVFADTKNDIRAFDGCTYLALMKDHELPNVYYTHSKWISDEALQLYRKSSLFKDTWAKTKILFNDKPLAYSLRTVEMV